MLGQFLDALDDDTANGIKAVAMDMGLAYQCAVKQWLPNADVFDRFHVMQMYSKALVQVRRALFKRADDEGKEMLKGSRYLILPNKCNLNESQQSRRELLLPANAPLNEVYILKEQLQSLWDKPVSFEQMNANLDAWCELADGCGLAPIKRVAATLRNHAVSVCNYVRHPISNACVEAGNVAIRLIRKRAQDIKDLKYFILKIFQISTPSDEYTWLSAGHEAGVSTV